MNFDARPMYMASSYYIVESVDERSMYTPGDIITEIQLSVAGDQITTSHPCGGQTIYSRQLAKLLKNTYGHTPAWKRLLLGEVCLPTGMEARDA